MKFGTIFNMHFNPKYVAVHILVSFTVIFLDDGREITTSVWGISAPSFRAHMLFRGRLLGGSFRGGNRGRR